MKFNDSRNYRRHNYYDPSCCAAMMILSVNQSVSQQELIMSNISFLLYKIVKGCILYLHVALYLDDVMAAFDYSYESKGIRLK